MVRKITSPADLKKVRDEAVADMDLRAGAKEVRITVHMGTCGIAAGAREILKQLMEELGRPAIAGVSLHQAGCAGLCEKEPMITLTDKSGHAFRYGRLDKDKVTRIVEEHVLSGNPVKEFLLSE